MVFGSKKQQTRTAIKKKQLAVNKNKTTVMMDLLLKNKNEKLSKNRVPSFPPAYQQNCNDLAQHYFFKA
jgi:hypothetical protein